MRKTTSGVLGLALAALGLAGCGTYSIPRVAAQGTTIVFPVPDAFGAGFGRALSNSLPFGDINPADNGVPFNASSPLEDFQRGELLFVLRTGPTIISSSIVAYLPVRYITRVHADEASGAALPAADENFFNVGTPIAVGQIVAFVDIPYATLPGTYYVFIERWRRMPGGSNYFEKIPPKMTGFDYSGGTATLPWQGWAGWGGFGGYASSPDAAMKIRVVASSYASALFHDTTWGFDEWNGKYSWLDHTDDINHLVPNLKLRIWIADYSTLNFPAAFEMTLAYPACKVEITGATLGRIHRSGGLVNVSTAGSLSDCDEPGTTRISMIDPDRLTHWVDVVYRLRDYANYGRATVGDFAPVGAHKAYDVDGNPIDLPVHLDSEYSF